MKMFKPAKIFHSLIVIPKSKAPKLIDGLYEAGVCEPKLIDMSEIANAISEHDQKPPVFDIDLEPLFVPEEAKKAYEVEHRLRFVIDSLEGYKEIIQPENLLKSLFKPSPPIKHDIDLRAKSEILEEIERHLDIIEPKLRGRLDNLSKLNEKAGLNDFLLSNLEIMPEIDTAIFKPSHNLAVLVGISETRAFEKIKKELAKKAAVGIKDISKAKSIIAIFSLPESVQSINKLLHDIGFEIIDFPYEDRTPSLIKKELKHENERLGEETKRIRESLEKLERMYCKRLSILSMELRDVKEKVEVLKKFKTTYAFSALEAWVPEKDKAKMADIIKKATANYYIEFKDDDNAPTLYNNHRLIAPFELITNLYSPPKYGRFDPTPLIAVTFAIFFGLMLTDFFYGLVIGILAFFVYKGMGRYNKGVRNFSMIMMFFAVTTAFWGVVFGSYFGDFFQKIGFRTPMLIDSMRDVMVFLTLVLTIGALHIGIGLAVGFIENIKHDSIKAALEKQGVWLLFLLSFPLLVIGGVFAKIGLGAIALAVVMQLYFNFVSSGAIPSILSLFNFSGFIGDIFSYARLMALGIGTSGIALAVNFLALLSIDMVPVAGIIFGVIIFLIGHAFNIAMNSLGGFVHSTRLHFLEFFQKFYEGGGVLYEPFKAKRDDVIIK